MNPIQQRNHRTAVETLANTTSDALESVAARFIEQEARIESVNRDFMNAINEERTHRLKLADQQRAYVDAGDRTVLQAFQVFKLRGFWSRLNWLLTGR